MELYAGIDLHSTNSVIVVQDHEDKVIKRKRLPNDLETILAWLEPFRDALVGSVVESTYNWYWLVDGLQEHGYDDKSLRKLAHENWIRLLGQTWKE